MENTPNLELPNIMPSQAQKHVTHNEALRVHDALVQLSVKSASLAAPPTDPAEGERHIVAATPIGAWTGKGGEIAAFQNGAWQFHSPREGWLAFIKDENRLVYDVGAHGPISAARLGLYRGWNGSASARRQTMRIHFPPSSTRRCGPPDTRSRAAVAIYVTR